MLSLKKPYPKKPLLWEQDVGGSNPLAPTTKDKPFQLSKKSNPKFCKSVLCGFVFIMAYHTKLAMIIPAIYEDFRFLLKRRKWLSFVQALLQPFLIHRINEPLFDQVIVDLLPLLNNRVICLLGKRHKQLSLFKSVNNTELVQ